MSSSVTTTSNVECSHVQRRLAGLSSVVPYPASVVVASNVVYKEFAPNIL